MVSIDEHNNEGKFNKLQSGGVFFGKTTQREVNSAPDTFLMKTGDSYVVFSYPISDTSFFLVLICNNMCAFGYAEKNGGYYRKNGCFTLHLIWLLSYLAKRE